ncbi:integrase/recombinase XerD [Paenibacillus taihuensis]|uniref:Integrase/recombinase XerD n=1 Tax=Paenibacillus taihuensis TaxID=1156355 RepID=A0A3D9S347_9BACL|nr:tyrosine-type recombinase/integrase [Paenibacillus taihuensis]REE84571.1 integrase/recombinase XerD [Paenibacillus taihuensis]
MKVQTIQTGTGKRYIVLDNNYKVIEPVLKYLKYLDSLERSPYTLKTYAHFLKIYCEFLEKNRLTVYSIFEAKQGAIEILVDYIGWLKGNNTQSNIKVFRRNRKTRSNATINNMLVAVQGMYTFLANNKEIPKVEFYKEKMGTIKSYKGFLHETTKKSTTRENILKLKTVQDESYEFITREQYNILYKACNNRRDKLIIALMFECGLRIGEVIGLHIEDCKPQDGSIYITHRENLPNDARVKNHSEGVAFMPDYVISLLIDYLTEDILDVHNDMLFVNLYRGNIGEAIKVNTVEDLFKRLSLISGIKVNPHMLRHGFATERKKSGLDLMSLKELLRHNLIQSTMIYTHVTNEDKRDMAIEFYESKQESAEYMKRFTQEVTVR